ncbi:hypothetical protein [Micromonospora deserti]|uniref:hypothetical protein n=1 Tax=Micromonospora deserti TaxID=2070366 RepID=UPI001F2F3966|nr:hypothetical protein [Micromonospora deserti]
MTVNGCSQRTIPPGTFRGSAPAGHLVTEGHVRVDGLITHHIPFADAHTAYDLIDKRPEETIKEPFPS